MDSLRQYILTVITIAVACGILQMLLSNGTAASLVKAICGLAVTITVLSPLIKEDVFQWNLKFEDMISDGTLAVSEGEQLASDMLKQRIKEKSEAYIMTKASELGANISAEVKLSADYPNSPETVTIKGNVSPYVRQQMSICLTTELGISEENQIWTSKN